MSQDEARQALEDCDDDAADAGDDQQRIVMEPAAPLVHSFETTVDPLVDRPSDRFPAWRTAPKRRNG